MDAEAPGSKPDPQREIARGTGAAGRNAKGQFAKGHPPTPGGGRPKRPDEWAELWTSIRRVEKEKKASLFDHFVRRAFVEDTVLVALFRRLLPSRIEGRVTHEEIERVIVQLVSTVTAHETDPDRIQAIADECNRIATLSARGWPNTQ